MELLRKIIILISVIFWPLGLFLTLRPDELITYFLPAAIIILSYWLYASKSKSYPLPILIIPFINSKLTLLPLIIFLSYFFIKNSIPQKMKIVLIFLSISILAINSRTFLDQSVFKLEYEKKQEILRNINLYPNATYARIFQNKARIITDKFSNNVLALIDPGNYFFSFHPREGVIVNQNLVKFPLLALVPIFIGLLDIVKAKKHKLLIALLSSSIFSLSVLEIFDRSDFILWFPFSLLLIYGFEIIFKHKNKIWPLSYSLLFILTALIELIRIIFVYL